MTGRGYQTCRYLRQGGLGSGRARRRGQLRRTLRGRGGAGSLARPRRAAPAGGCVRSVRLGLEGSRGHAARDDHGPRARRRGGGGRLGCRRLDVGGSRRRAARPAVRHVRPVPRRPGAHCDAARYVGLGGAPGGLAELTVVTPLAAFPFPADLEPRHAALVEPFAVGLHTVHAAGLEAGDDVLVIGAGTVGLTAIVLGVCPRRRSHHRGRPHVGAPWCGADLRRRRHRGLDRRRRRRRLRRRHRVRRQARTCSTPRSPSPASVAASWSPGCAWSRRRSRRSPP